MTMCHPHTMEGPNRAECVRLHNRNFNSCDKNGDVTGNSAIQNRGFVNVVASVLCREPTRASSFCIPLTIQTFTYGPVCADPTWRFVRVSSAGVLGGCTMRVGWIYTACEPHYQTVPPLDIHEMGGSQSKLSPQQLSDLQGSTHCKLSRRIPFHRAHRPTVTDRELQRQ
jgi:hypothetical protein